MKKKLFIAIVGITIGAQAQSVIVETTEGNVGVGTTNPINKNESTGVPTVLHVKKTDVSGDVEVARFEGGNDNDNTAAIVRINHSNDRGLYLKGGRRNSDRSFGEIGIIGTLGNFETPSIAMDDNGVVSVGGDIAPAGGISPDTNRKLYVNGGLTIKSGSILSLDKNYYVHAYSQFESSVPEARFLNYGFYGHRWQTRSGVGMVMLGNNNNVGIGTTTPTTTLDVNGVITSRNEIRALSANPGILLDESDVNDKNWHIQVNGGNLKIYEVNDTRSNWSQKMFIESSSGNIGIGTSDTKGFKLGVNGKVVATEVKVAAYDNWPDYVFKKGYDLPTLTEVESHIKEKGHLQNIPSASEVKKEGFFLGEMDAKLLQKIEELTLYTIQQEKQLKQQSKEIEELKEMVEKFNKS